MKHFEGDLVYSPQTILPKSYCFGQSRFFLTRFYGKSFQKDRSVRYRTLKNERSTCLASVPIEPSVNARQESTEHQ